MELDSFDKNLISNSLNKHIKNYSDVCTSRLLQIDDISISAILSSYLGSDGWLGMYRHDNDNVLKEKGHLPNIKSQVSSIQNIYKSLEGKDFVLDNELLYCDDFVKREQYHNECFITYDKSVLSLFSLDGSNVVSNNGNVIDKNDGRLYVPKAFIENKFSRIILEKEKYVGRSTDYKIETYQLKINKITDSDSYESLFFVVLSINDNCWNFTEKPNPFKNYPDKGNNIRLLCDYFICVNKQPDVKILPVKTLRNCVHNDWMSVTNQTSVKIRNNDLIFNYLNEGLTIKYESAELTIKATNNYTMHMLIFDNCTK